MNGNCKNIYEKIRAEEKHSKAILMKFEEDYPDTAKESNVNDILKTLKEKKISD